MRALSIATSLCLASSVALAQSAKTSATSLDTCFKLVRVTEANCSPSANEAERQDCLLNARKMQRVCLELAGQQPAAPVDRLSAVAEAISSDKPAEAAAPTPPVISAARSIEPDKAVEAAPPAMATGSTVVPASSWTVSETSSPVDYSPLVTATILARSGNGSAPTALEVRCRGHRSELGLRIDGTPRALRGGEIPVAYQINDQPMVKSRWAASADGKSASYKGDATALLQALSEDARLKIMVSDGSGRDSEAAFQLAGWSVVRDKIAAACKWTSTASKSPERR
jgi:hypothetical protein